MAGWSAVEAHLTEYGVEFTRTNLAGTNSHVVRAAFESMGQRREAEVTSSLQDDRFSDEDLRDFFQDLGIAYPAWL